MEECAEKLKVENVELKKRITELSAENECLRSDKYSIDNELRYTKREKDRLLQIIENLSKGYASMER